MYTFIHTYFVHFIKLVGLISLISVLMFFANSLHDESNISPATVSSRLKTEKRMSALLSAENGEQHINDGDVSETDIE